MLEFPNEEDEFISRNCDRNRSKKSSQISELTIDGRREQNESIVQVLSVSLQAELGIVGELEVEIEAARLQGLEEQGVRRSESEIVEQDEHSAIGRSLRREGAAEKWMKN